MVRGAVWIVVVGLLAGCWGSGAAPRTDTVEAMGRLRTAGMTSFMYGSHLLVDPDRGLRFALRSGGAPLRDHEGEWVRITGTPVEGYPVDGGPVFLEVQSIRRIKPPVGAQR